MNANAKTLSHRTSALKRLEASLFATTVQLERGAIMFRIVAALPLALVMYSSRGRLPYWEFAIGAVVVMFFANLWLNRANRSGQITSMRSALVGSLIDTLLLLLVSNLAIRASADLNSTSEMWLIFPLVILAFSYRSKPVPGIIYAVLLTTWYAGHILLFFDHADRAVTELPIRATFFVLMGGLASILAGSLRQPDRE